MFCFGEVAIIHIVEYGDNYDNYDDHGYNGNGNGNENENENRNGSGNRNGNGNGNCVNYWIFKSVKK